MENLNQYMKIACDLAEYSVENCGGPFGAVIVDISGNIVGKGHNRVTMDNDPTQHAEIVAIRNACHNLNTFSLSGYTIYTSCEPCPMCLSAIYWARIENIYFGNTRYDAKEIGFDDEFIYNEIKTDVTSRIIPMQQICQDYAKKSFDLWKNNEKKTKY
jgi:tRNA(Arg) A34 adenosine deaminase TadA